MRVLPLALLALAASGCDTFQDRTVRGFTFYDAEGAALVEGVFDVDGPLTPTGRDLLEGSYLLHMDDGAVPLPVTGYATAQCDDDGRCSVSLSPMGGLAFTWDESAGDAQGEWFDTGCWGGTEAGTFAFR